MFNITEVTLAAGEDVARQEEYLESLSIIIFFIFMINKTRLCRSREYKEGFVILFMWMFILVLT